MLTVEAVRKAGREYREAVLDGRFERADFWHFCGFLGVDDETVLGIIRMPNKKQVVLAQELKKIVCWIKGQYAAAAGWSGSNSSKAMFLMKQDLGGVVLSDRPEKSDGKMEIVVQFGGKVEDPFG